MLVDRLVLVALFDRVVPVVARTARPVAPRAAEASSALPVTGRRAVAERALEVLLATRRGGGVLERAVQEGRDLGRMTAARALALVAEPLLADRDLTAGDLPRLLASRTRLYTQTHAHRGGWDKGRVKVKVKVGFLYSATYTANQNSALHNLGSGS